MVHLIESGFGIATLPIIAAHSLVKKHDIAILPCETALSPLPVQASYRDDPGSSALLSVVQDALKYIDAFRGNPKKSRASAKQGTIEAHKKNR
jgi:DNA-binding transcriptional LysR family regulator